MRGIKHKKEAREKRHYTTSPLPVLGTTSPANHEHEILLGLYREVCTSWRTLVDVRFKLLGLVPTVSLAIILTLFTNDQGRPRVLPIVQTGIAVLGFLITVGLLIYDRRNTMLHDDLISRARKIEKELGIDTGQFLGRLKPPHAFLQHDVATNLIYGTALLGWLASILWTLSQIR